MIKKIIKSTLQLCFSGSFIFEKVKALNGTILTFDDGPHPEHTPIILKELARRNIKAIFFVSGRELEKYPELGKMIVAHGHLLGNHTYGHEDSRDCSLALFKDSISKTERYISSSHIDKSYKPTFRPPYSSFSIGLLFYILFSDYLLINWTIDSRDSFIIEAGKLCEYVCNIEIRKGDILLFHEDYEHTVKALPEILDHLQRQGCRFILPW